MAANLTSTLGRRGNVFFLAYEERENMSTYTVHYKMSKGTSSVTLSKTVNAESEQTAIRIAEDEGKLKKPGYTFSLIGAPKKL